MSLEDMNKAAFRSHLRIWATGDLSALDEIINSDYVGHVAAGDRDRDGLIARIKAFRSLYPDIVFTVEDQIAVGDKVVTRMTAHGTYQPTGKTTTLIGINISRIVDGRIVEEWAVWETYEIR